MARQMLSAKLGNTVSSVSPSSSDTASSIGIPSVAMKYSNVCQIVQLEDSYIVI